MVSHDKEALDHTIYLNFFICFFFFKKLQKISYINTTVGLYQAA